MNSVNNGGEITMFDFGAAVDSGACMTAGATVGSAVLSALQFFAAAQCVLRDPYPPDRHPCNESLFDFIIVGGGTAGSALAARLATNFTVLLLEAGSDPPAESIIPGFKSTMMGTIYDWKFTTEDDGLSSQALQDGRQPQPRGRMLGGCGSLNDMVYSRGYPIDYDDWAASLAAIGDKDAQRWAWPHVLDFFKKTEHLTDERIINEPELMKLHGRNGDIEVSGLNESTFETDMFLGAFKELGFNMVKDMTSPAEIGAGRHSHTIRDGIRDSTLSALLNKAPQSKLYVMKDTLVTKILISNNTAYGVRALYKNVEIVFYVNMEVIVTAGTFNTPKLLMLSGVGPKEHLKEFEIPLHADLPVGKNLHDHVMVLNYLAADNGTCYMKEASAHMNTIRYLYDHGGPLSVVNTMAAYMALNDTTSPNIPDFAFFPSCMPVGTDFYMHCRLLLRFNKKICNKLQNVLKDRELLSIAAVLLKPKSRGRVELMTTNPRKSPAIYSGTFSDVSDLDGYPQAIELVKSIANTEYFRRKNTVYVDLEIAACAGLESAKHIQCVARATAMSAWHSVGTAAMGEVLDARLRVFGVSGLRVADASIMPRVVRGNTNAPVVMIAEQAAAFLHEEYSLPPCRRDQEAESKPTVVSTTGLDNMTTSTLVPEAMPMVPIASSIVPEFSAIPESSATESLLIGPESSPAVTDFSFAVPGSLFTTPDFLSVVPESLSVVSGPSDAVSESSVEPEPSPIMLESLSIIPESLPVAPEFLTVVQELTSVVSDTPPSTSTSTSNSDSTDIPTTPPPPASLAPAAAA